jgi:dTDP-4-amino-4,6-dideoxygalactose transaminase
MDWHVVLSDITLDEAEAAAVTDVLASRWLSMGSVTQAFERSFAAALGATDAVMVSSGTAALHLAAVALGLGPGDEVIVPSLSFVASAATIALTGARPVFAEVVGPHDLTLAPDDVVRRITPRTKAIVVVHYAGYPANMSALVSLARQHGLAVIEDSAHAPIVRGETGMLGTLGDIGCFSFFATKNLTTGEGGMVVARDPALLAKIRGLRAHCMTTTSWDKHQGRASTYDVSGLGFNYRPTEIAAALGNVQLTKLDADRSRRRALVEAYRSLLIDLPELELPFANRSGDSAFHLFPVLLPPHASRADIQGGLAAQGIQSSVHYPPIHLFSFYREHYGYASGHLPITESVAARELSLPLHARLSNADVQLVAGALREALRGRA